MSKLDFITILIVAICVGALGFLVYKTVRLMNPDETTPEVIENTDTTTDNFDEYALDDEGEVISDDSTNMDGSSLDETSSGQDEEYPIDDDASYTDSSTDDVNTKITKESEPASYGASSSGAYMVLAGSYKQKINATNQVNKLRKMGYDDAEIRLFNNGALAVALVNRFDSYGEAAALKKELEAKGFDVFIKKKKK